MQLLKEKARLAELLRDTDHRVDQWLELSEKTFEFACSARQWFARGDLKVKKEIVSAIGSNLILKDKKLLIQAKNPFFILETSLSRIRNAKCAFEPEILRIHKGKSAPVRALSPTSWRGKDDVRIYGGAG